MSIKYVTLNCPSCGAPVDDKQERCSSCGERLLLEIDNTGTSLLQIKSLLEISRYSEATEKCSEILSHGIVSADVYYYLCIALLEGKKPYVQSRNRIDECIDALDRALTISDKGIIYLLRAYIEYDSYDSLVKNLIDKRASNAKEYLGLDESEIMEIEPIELSGYIFSGAQRYKMGNDRLYRSNLFEKAIIFFTRNEVHMYKATVDSITGKTTENTEVLFYEDIVSVSTENENERFGNVSIDYLSFVLTSKGGKPFKVALLGTDNRQRSINAMRALIKEKKMK